MKVKRIAGIDRVLDQVLTSPSRHGHNTAENAAGATKRSSSMTSVSLTEDRRVTSRAEARRGRPIGKRTSMQSPKEKVTFRISRHLIADYRDWSWEARCQLSELVERALFTYQQSHGQRQ